MFPPFLGALPNPRRRHKLVSVLVGFFSSSSSPPDPFEPQASDLFFLPGRLTTSPSCFGPQRQGRIPSIRAWPDANPGEMASQRIGSDQIGSEPNRALREVAQTVRPQKESREGFFRCVGSRCIPHGEKGRGGEAG